MRENVRWIIVSLGEFLLAVVVCSSEDGAGPVCEETLGLSLDSKLWPLALDVEHDDFANA